MAQAANPYAAPAAQLTSKHKACDACGAEIHERAEICPKCGVRQRRPVSKTVLLLLTFFGGGLGAHKFYLGKYWQGAFYLIFFWTWIPALIALIEFVIYAFTSSERLNEKYEASGAAAVVVILVVIAFLGIAMIGILAAVALPAYQDYTQRARVAEVLANSQPWRTAVAELYAATKALPNSASELPGGAPPGASRYGNVNLGPGGVLTLTLTDAVAGQGGKTVVLTPQSSPDGLSWLCRPGTLAPKYLPASCRL